MTALTPFQRALSRLWLSAALLAFAIVSVVYTYQWTASRDGAMLLGISAPGVVVQAIAADKAVDSASLVEQIASQGSAVAFAANANSGIIVINDPSQQLHALGQAGAAVSAASTQEVNALVIDMPPVRRMVEELHGSPTVVGTIPPATAFDGVPVLVALSSSVSPVTSATFLVVEPSDTLLNQLPDLFQGSGLEVISAHVVTPISPQSFLSSTYGMSLAVAGVVLIVANAFVANVAAMRYRSRARAAALLGASRRAASRLAVTPLLAPLVGGTLGGILAGVAVAWTLAAPLDNAIAVVDGGALALCVVAAVVVWLPILILVQTITGTWLTHDTSH